MSTSPYSVDLRGKVIHFLKSGKSQTETSIVFGINRMTINKWNVRYKNEGHYLPKVRLGAKSKIDTGFFIEYVATHPNATSEALLAQDIGSGAWVLAIKKSLPLLGS